MAGFCRGFLGGFFSGVVLGDWMRGFVYFGVVFLDIDWVKSGFFGEGLGNDDMVSFR